MYSSHALLWLLTGLLLVSACDFAPSGDPPESASGPFAFTLDLSFDGRGSADTLVLGRYTRLAFTESTTQAHLQRLRVYLNDRLVAETADPRGLVLDVTNVSDGAGTLRIEGVISYPQAGVHTRVLLDRPVYVEHAPPAIAGLALAVDNGFVSLRWERGARRLPDSVHITRSGPEDLTSAGRRPITTMFRLLASTPTVRWRDSSYVGEDAHYYVRVFSANGEAEAEATISNDGANLQYVFARDESRLAWQRPRAAHVTQFIVQRNTRLFGPPQWEEVAVLDSSARSWPLAPAPYGRAVTERYRLAAHSPIASAPTIPYAEQVSPVYGTPVPGMNDPARQTYYYNEVHDVYYVWSGPQVPYRVAAWGGARSPGVSSAVDGVAAIAVSPDGRVFTRGSATEVCERDPRTLAIQRCVAASPFTITTLAASLSGMLLIGGATKQISYDFDAQQAGPTLAQAAREVLDINVDRSGTWARVRERVYERTSDGFALRYTAPDADRAAFDLDARVGYVVSGTTLTTIDLSTGQAKGQTVLPVRLQYLHIDPSARLLGGEAGSFYHAFDLGTFEPTTPVPLAYAPGWQQSYQLLMGRLYQRAPDPSLFYAQTFTYVELR